MCNIILIIYLVCSSLNRDHAQSLSVFSLFWNPAAWWAIMYKRAAAAIYTRNGSTNSLRPTAGGLFLPSPSYILHRLSWIHKYAQQTTTISIILLCKGNLQTWWWSEDISYIANIFKRCRYMPFKATPSTRSSLVYVKEGDIT